VFHLYNSDHLDPNFPVLIITLQEQLEDHDFIPEVTGEGTALALVLLGVISPLRTVTVFKLVGLLGYISLTDSSLKGMRLSLECR